MAGLRHRAWRRTESRMLRHPGLRIHRRRASLEEPGAIEPRVIGREKIGKPVRDVLRGRRMISRLIRHAIELVLFAALMAILISPLYILGDLLP